MQSKKVRLTWRKLDRALTALWTAGLKVRHLDVLSALSCELWLVLTENMTVFRNSIGWPNMWFFHFVFLLSSPALKRYSPLWPFASKTIFLHSRRSMTIVCMNFIPNIFKTSSTSSLHLLRGLSLLLLSSIAPAAVCFGILWFCISST